MATDNTESDDDRQGDSPTENATASQVYYENDGSSSTSDETAPSSDTGVTSTAASETGTTQAGQAGLGGGSTVIGENSTTRPGGRSWNPLADFSSYTYQLSLYMLVPEAYQKFIVSGETNVDGFYLVAQSGGINSQGPNKRAPGFTEDVYIDDAVFRTFVQGKSNEGAATVPAFEFKIYEPYGFSFTQKLREAAWKVISKSQLTGIRENTNALSQFYMLGIKFYGYDSLGNLVDNSKYAQANMASSADKNALFTRYYPITITDFKFKLDGKMVVYSIKAANVSVQEGFGVKRGQLPNPVELVGETVQDILQGANTGSKLVINPGNTSKPTDKKNITGLIQAMNEAEKQLEKEGITKKANVYNVKFIDDVIPSSSILSPAEVNKFKLAANTVKKTKDSTDAAAASEVVNINARTVSIRQGTPLVQVIDQVIGQSDYVTSALNTLMTETNEDENGSEVNQRGRKLQWYSVNPIAVPLGYDSARNDYAFEITYEIRPYKIPFVQSAYVRAVDGYLGPHKRYSYWYTGKNKEILSYEQQYNSLYFIGSVKKKPNANSDPKVPIAYNKPQNAASEFSFDKAGEAVASIRASLYDPNSQASARISILGDPDFLMTCVGVNSDPFTAFYGSDFSINPNGGEVFIEIDFNNATDYSNDTGLMSINHNIEFYRYPKELKSKIKGIAYLVNTVTSTFSKGKFTQDLDLIIASFNNPDTAPTVNPDDAGSDRESPAEPTTSERTPSNDTSTPTADQVGSPDDGSMGTEVRDETGALSNLRQNEYGDLYDPTGTTMQDNGRGQQVADEDGSASTYTRTTSSDEGGREEG